MMNSPSPEQRQAFAVDGAFIAKGFLSPTQLAQSQACFDWGLGNPGPRATRVFPGSEHEHYNDQSAPGSWEAGLQTLVLESGFVDYLAQLWGSEHVWYFGEEYFIKSGGKVGNSPWHQDHSVVPMQGQHWVNLWISFEHLPAQNSLGIIRGSHQGKLYNGAAYTDPLDPTKPLHPDSELPRLPDIDADLVRDSESWDVMSFDTEPGDIVVLHPCALHGGAPVDSDTPERHTIVLRFFGDDATYSSLPNTDWPVMDSQTDGAPFRSSIFPQLR